MSLPLSFCFVVDCRLMMGDDDDDCTVVLMISENLLYYLRLDVADAADAEVITSMIIK